MKLKELVIHPPYIGPNGAVDSLPKLAQGPFSGELVGIQLRTYYMEIMFSDNESKPEDLPYSFSHGLQRFSSAKAPSTAVAKVQLSTGSRHGHVQAVVNSLSDLQGFSTLKDDYERFRVSPFKKCYVPTSSDIKIRFEAVFAKLYQSKTGQLIDLVQGNHSIFINDIPLEIKMSDDVPVQTPDKLLLPTPVMANHSMDKAKRMKVFSSSQSNIQSNAATIHQINSPNSNYTVPNSFSDSSLASGPFVSSPLNPKTSSSSFNQWTSMKCFLLECPEITEKMEFPIALELIRADLAVGTSKLMDHMIQRVYITSRSQLAQVLRIPIEDLGRRAEEINKCAAFMKSFPGLIDIKVNWEDIPTVSSVWPVRSIPVLSSEVNLGAYIRLL